MPTKIQLAESAEILKCFIQTTIHSKPAWKCCLPKCEKYFHSSQSNVRKRHLKVNHPDVLNSIGKKVKEQHGQDSESSDDENVIRVNLSKKRVTDACVEMVTKNGLPFNTMDGSGFAKILDPIIEALAAINQPLTINRNTIKAHVQTKADDIVRRIKEKLKGRMVSIMIDMATRQSRSILGISVQCMLNQKIVVLTLAMDHITSKHTGIEIKERLLAVLKKYEIQANQIFAITTDNGSNMIKTIELISELQPTESNHRIENVLNLLSESIATIELQQSGDESSSTDDDETTESQKNVECQLEEMRKSIENIFADDTIFSFTNAISCAIHTMQLGIKDAFNDPNFVAEKLLMEKCTQLVRALRVPSALKIIDRENFSRPIKKVQTRWNTDQMMVCLQRNIYFFSCGIIFDRIISVGTIADSSTIL